MIDLKQTLLSLGQPKILVLGDLMLDRSVWGNAERVSPEAPVVVLQADQQDVGLGGAASVAAQLRALEAEVVLAGVVGDDSEGRILTNIIREGGIFPNQCVIVDKERPTTTKQRFIGRAANRHPHQMLRVDMESTRPVSGVCKDKLQDSILHELRYCQALLISDYGKGACPPNLLSVVIAQATALGIPVLIDPARDVEFARYQGASCLTPNRAEAAQASGITIHSPQDAIRAGKQLRDRYSISSILVTLDRDGIALIQSDEAEEVFPTQSREVYDITGAGDMVLAVVGLCAACEISLKESVRLANFAAGKQVEQFGASPVSKSELLQELNSHQSLIPSKIVSLDQIVVLTKNYRNNGKRIVFTNGCFDLMHRGHISCLQEAATHGDVLIVAINSDRSVRELKGSTRPVVSELHRAEMLAALECVTHVLVFDGKTPHGLLQSIEPEVLVKGGTYSVDEVVGHELVEAYGGEVIVTTAIPGVSTTQLFSSIGDE